jgi:hypothetical protein
MRHRCLQCAPFTNEDPTSEQPENFSATELQIRSWKEQAQRTMEGKEPNRSLNRSANRVRDL